jgi:hypothetical protein
MKKRLGTIPKGLEWISQESQLEITKPVRATPAQVTSAKTVSAQKRSMFGQVNTLEIPSARRGLQEDLTRATFIMKQEFLEKIKAYAYWERVQIKDVLDEMCEQFFENKKVRSIPEKQK